MTAKLKCFTQKRDSYYYTPTFKGKTKWIPLGNDKSTALLRYYSLIEGGYCGVSINDLLDNYIRSESFSTKHLSKRSIDTYEYGMAHVRAGMGHLDAAEVNATTISRFIHAAPGSSGNGWVSPLSQAYKRGILDGLVDSSPFRKGDIQYKPNPVRVRVVHLEEIMKVREQISPHGKFFIDMCLMTGLRISDILGLTSDCITDEGLEVKIQKKRRSHQVLLFKWTPELKALSHSISLFEGGTSTTAMSKRFNRACKAAGVEDLTCHDVRRFVLQEAKRRGMNAQQIAGHSNASQTANYTLGVPDSVETLPKLDSTSDQKVSESPVDQPRLRLVQ